MCAVRVKVYLPLTVSVKHQRKFTSFCYTSASRPISSLWRSEFFFSFRNQVNSMKPMILPNSVGPTIISNGMNHQFSTSTSTPTGASINSHNQQVTSQHHHTSLLNISSQFHHSNNNNNSNNITNLNHLKSHHSPSPHSTSASQQQQHRNINAAGSVSGPFNSNSSPGAPVHYLNQHSSSGQSNNFSVNIVPRLPSPCLSSPGTTNGSSSLEGLSSINSSTNSGGYSNGMTTNTASNNNNNNPRKCNNQFTSSSTFSYLSILLNASHLCVCEWMCSLLPPPLPPPHIFYLNWVILLCLWFTPTPIDSEPLLASRRQLSAASSYTHDDWNVKMLMST